MTSFPWSFVYIVVALGAVVFFARWAGNHLTWLNDKIQAKAVAHADAKKADKERRAMEEFASPWEKSSALLVSFYIGNGGYRGDGLGMLFTEIEAQEVNTEKMYSALQHHGVGSIIPILREAHAYHQAYNADEIQDGRQMYIAKMDEFTRRVENAPGIASLEEAYRTNGSSLQAKSTENL